MKRFLMPIILIGISVGLFVMFINPGVERIKSAGLEGGQYEDALKKSRELISLRDELNSIYNSFETNDLVDLKKMVPDHVDNVRLIIEIDNIASQYGMTVRDAELANSTSSKSDSDEIISIPGTGKEEISLSFSVISSYETFLKFLNDLEHSLRIVDIEKIDFIASDVDLNEYSLTVKTYWLSS